MNSIIPKYKANIYQLYINSYERSRTYWCMFNALFFITFGGIPCIFTSVVMSYFLKKVYVQKFVCYWASVYFKIILWSSGIDVYVQGLENIQSLEPFIFACNHTSFCDIPVMYSILPYWSTPLAKKELGNIPVFGWLVKLSGCILIDKTNTRDSISKLNNIVVEYDKNPRSILIFPEGRRSEDDSLQPFKTGCFIMACQLRTPIIPVAICGCHDVIGRNLTMSSKINSRSHIKLIIGKPIPTDNLNPFDDRYKLRDRVYNDILTLKNNAYSHDIHNFKKIKMSFFRCFIPN